MFNKMKIFSHQTVMIRKVHEMSIVALAAVLGLLASCSREQGMTSVENDDDGSYVKGLTVSIATRSAESGGGESGNAGNGHESINLNELIPYELTFDGNTILQVSQQTINMPPFQTGDAIYDYRYIPTYEASDNAWDEDYNFAPYGTGEPLRWDTISDRGSYNGSFALYCMYFPIENTIRSEVNENGAINYRVMDDQSTVDNLKKSDILGAYHSTQEVFSRIRFRLFHLMTYFRIRLYVPVYDDEKNTGYREDALQYATLDNVTPYFAIDWSVNRSSDEQGPVVSALSGDGHIKMYLHPLPGDKTQHEIEEIKYKDYLPKDYFDQGIEGDYDKVRVYDFSVILPKQKGIMIDGKEINFTDTEFLSFYLRTNSGSTTRYYFSQAFSANTTESTMEMEQGVFQYLQLYVPRVGNQVVFVGAKVNPWNQMTTDMVLKEQPE